MSEPGLRKLRIMMRAYWIRTILQLVGFVAGTAVWLLIALRWRGKLGGLSDLAWEELVTLDGIHWLISFAVGAVCGVVMLWVRAELIGRTSYPSEAEI